MIKWFVLFLCISFSAFASPDIKEGDMTVSTTVCTEEASLFLFSIHKNRGVEEAAKAINHMLKNDVGCWMSPPLPYTVDDVVDMGVLPGDWQGWLIYTKEGVTIPHLEKGGQET